MEAAEAPAAQKRPLPSANVSLSRQWASMQNRREAQRQAQSHAEFDAQVREEKASRAADQMRLIRGLAGKRQVGVDTEEEEMLFYPRSGYRGRWFFALLCPSNPARARRRVERMYWENWHAFAYGIFLSSIGAMLLVLGGLWTYYGEERIRGIGVLIAAVLLCIPGFYSLFVLLMYVRGVKGYSYRQLPDGW